MQPSDDSRAATFSKEDLIRAGYRVLLGREPENETVVAAAAASLTTPDEVLCHFTTSDEFKDSQPSHDFLSVVRNGLHAPAANIEVNVRPDQLEALFERVRKQWGALGETDPHWSVITSERFRKETFEQHRAEFETSGRHAAQLLKSAADRTGLTLPRGTWLELGSGVGRVTRFLAGSCERIIGVDISACNIGLCRDYLDTAAISNVDLKLLATPSDLTALPDYDLLFSVIVLLACPPEPIPR